ncbi:hypothetical protein [Emticicia sp. C21]|uniref:hypothetical protein n=1 Tax=Emticicia sp. C21 TaxID=2302915 RepID=UPI000E34E0CD|nr:hypothetical protein [Emticicia sp. C21]RFS17900.1 hypothetical protein D0T08_01245 [Emticicia sp. C21]
MKNIHLTDEEIQRYALETENCPKVWTDHIQHCPHCQQQVQAYQLLFEGIESQEQVMFDFDLADLVIEQLPQSKPVQDKPFVFSIAAVVALMIGVAGYVFGNSLTNLFFYLQPILVGLVILTSFGVMVFLGIDMYQRYKVQMKVLNFY